MLDRLLTRHDDRTDADVGDSDDHVTIAVSNDHDHDHRKATRDDRDHS
ncbi:hypothetical protein [Haloferax sp. YSSS75]